MSSEQAQTKKFQKGERTIPAPSQQASKYYPAEDDAQPKKVRSSVSTLSVGVFRDWQQLEEARGGQ